MRPAPLLVLSLVAAGACNWERPPEKKPINCYLADSRDLMNVRRIMVLPFGEEPGLGSDRERIRSAFITELQKLRRFEIVPLPESASEVEGLNATVREGRVSTEAVVALADRYHLDGVLTGIVTDWRPYMPQHLGLRTQLYSVHSGTAVWAVDALYDAADRSTISDIAHYHETFEADDGSLHGRDMTLIAPTRFAAYVAHRVVGTWSSESSD
ncbi:MAG: hypothetical protein Fur0037_14130 [Planctomycetota bacterium]